MIDKALPGAKRACSVNQVAIIVENGSITENDFTVRSGIDFPGDLCVEDPLLGGDGRILIDGERTTPGNLPHHFKVGIASFECCGELETQRRLPNTVTTNESDLHRWPIVTGVMSFEL